MFDDITCNDNGDLQLEYIPVTATVGTILSWNMGLTSSNPPRTGNEPLDGVGTSLKIEEDMDSGIQELSDDVFCSLDE